MLFKEREIGGLLSRKEGLVSFLMKKLFVNNVQEENEDLENN